MHFCNFLFVPLPLFVLCLFAVADVVQVLTDSEDVKQYIKKMRARDPELNSRWGTICIPTRTGTEYFGRGGHYGDIEGSCFGLYPTLRTG